MLTCTKCNHQKEKVLQIVKLELDEKGMPTQIGKTEFICKECVVTLMNIELLRLFR